MRTEKTLDEALDDYYMTRRGRYARSTWKAHYQRLEHWRQWINKQVDAGPRSVYLTTLADFDGRYMERYFNLLRPPAFEPSTFNLFRQILNQFWTFCRREGWVDLDPMRHVDPLRVPLKARLMLSVDEMEAMLDGAIPRDRVALALGMNTGLRGGDITKLTVGDVNLGNLTLSAWIEKTDKAKELPITAELHDELLRWFRVYAESFGISDLRLLPNTWRLVPPIRASWVQPGRPEAGKIITYAVNDRMTAPQKIIHDALRRIGHADNHKGVGFHILRRSAARALYDLAVADGEADPITRSQELLDHGSRIVTERYIQRSHEKQKLDEMLRGRSFLGRAKAARTPAEKPELGRRIRSA